MQFSSCPQSQSRGLSKCRIFAHDLYEQGATNNRSSEVIINKCFPKFDVIIHLPVENVLYSVVTFTQ